MAQFTSLGSICQMALSSAEHVANDTARQLNRAPHHANLICDYSCMLISRKKNPIKIKFVFPTDMSVSVGRMTHITAVNKDDGSRMNCN